MYCSCFSLNSQDLDECTHSNGGCSHICHNSAGSYTCSCPSGMELDSGKRSCKGDLIPSSGNGIFEKVPCILQKVDFLFYIGHGKEVLEVKLYIVSLR